jgi:hypothetical protein
MPTDSPTRPNHLTTAPVPAATHTVPAATPPPTVTPLAFATAAPDETLTLIATFYVCEGGGPRSKIELGKPSKILFWNMFPIIRNILY